MTVLYLLLAALTWAASSLSAWRLGYLVGYESEARENPRRANADHYRHKAGVQRGLWMAALGPVGLICMLAVLYNTPTPPTKVDALREADQQRLAELEKQFDLDLAREAEREKTRERISDSRVRHAELDAQRLELDKRNAALRAEQRGYPL